VLLPLIKNANNAR